MYLCTSLFCLCSLKTRILQRQVAGLPLSQKCILHQMGLVDHQDHRFRQLSSLNFERRQQWQSLHRKFLCQECPDQFLGYPVITLRVPSVSVHRLFFSLAQCLITLHWWNSQENPTAAEEQEQIVVPSFVQARTSYHNTAEEIQPVGTHGMRGYMVGKNVVDKLNMHHPPWCENTSTMITQRRIKVSLAKVENNTKHKTIMPSFLLPDGLFAVRTITSFIHDCNRYCETLRCWTT